MQSYQNVSNSQPFKALAPSIKVANAYAKLSKCQQFTTLKTTIILLNKLQTLMQSYQNVSNSQPESIADTINNSCKRLCKVIKMLAIHNTFGIITVSFKLQTLMQSYQNVSNSQPATARILVPLSCKRLCKVIKMLAIHNQMREVLLLMVVANAYAKLSKCQQFTTWCGVIVYGHGLQTLMQSYQNVSNSQLLSLS